MHMEVVFYISGKGKREEKFIAEQWMMDSSTLDVFKAWLPRHFGMYIPGLNNQNITIETSGSTMEPITNTTLLHSVLKKRNPTFYIYIRNLEQKKEMEQVKKIEQEEKLEQESSSEQENGVEQESILEQESTLEQEGGVEQ